MRPPILRPEMKTARLLAGLFVICDLAPLDDYDDLNAKHAVPPRWFCCLQIFVVRTFIYPFRQLVTVGEISLWPGS